MRRFTNFWMVALFVAAVIGAACKPKEEPGPVPEPAKPAVCRITTAVGGGSAPQPVYECKDEDGKTVGCPANPADLPECQES